MSNRFDDMMVQGINTSDATATAGDILQGKTAYAGGQKITGVLSPGGGSDDYNVFLQNSEPQSKDGVWIKESGSGSPNVYFSNAISTEGDFVDNDTYSGFTQSDPISSQVIIGDYLYSFGIRKNPAMYKYNLKTKEYIGNLSYPSEYYAGSPYVDITFAFEYQGNILVFYFDGYGVKYYTYYPNSDTYSAITIIPNTDWNASTLYWFFIEKYEDDVYIYFNAHYPGNVARKYNLIDKTLANINAPSLDTWTGGSNIIPFASTSKVGNTMFILTAKYSYNGSWNITGIDSSLLKKFVLGGDGTATTISMPTSSGTAVKLSAIYALGNYLYGFAYGSDQTKYYVYDIENNTWEERTSLIPYSILYGYVYNFPYKSSLCVYDYNRGVLYIRVASTSLINVFQLPNSPLSQDLDVGTVVINQDFSGQMVKLQDDSNLYVGISNVGIVDTESNEKYIDGDCLAFWGDGEKWNLLKNPNAETVTVSFNTDGGSGTFASQTVVIGQKATQPQNVPIKSGDYVFDCWYLGNEPYDWNYKPVSDITLTAHYIEYEEVEFIQSTGTQYIDTGIINSSSIRIVTEISVSGIGKMNGTDGSVGSTDRFKWGTNGDGVLYMGYGTTGITTQVTPIAGTYYTFDMAYGSQSISQNGNVLGSLSDTSIVNYDTSSIILFAKRGSNGAISTYASGMKIKSCEIYDSGTLVRNFVPIQITSTGEYCLYDEVEGKLYKNAGTGTFNYGEVVE